MGEILVIQDSLTITATLKYRLESNGFLVDTAETGEEGVEKAKGNGYQLILLDLNLPGIDGLEVLKTLRADKHTGNIPVVLVSARDEEELSKLAAESGAEGYITIPFEGNKFIKKVKEFLEKR